MSTFCDCPLVCEDNTKTLCTLCGNKIPAPLTDEAADRMLLVENTLTREAVLNLGVAPDHWDDADHAKLHAVAAKWNLSTTNPGETLLDYSRFHVFTIVYAKFREEYGDLITGIHGGNTVTHLYTAYKDLGKKEFHKFLGEELQYKLFCDRFYDRLREMYNIDSVGMREEFEKMREKKQTFYQYELELQKQRKR
jgi:hypothetical protein